MGVDGGRGPLAARDSTADLDIRHWEKLLPIYAEVQIELASRLQIILELGAPNRQWRRCPHSTKQRLADRSVLLIDEPGFLPSP